MARVLDDNAAFGSFAILVLEGAADERAVKTLRADVNLWWARYHAIMSASLPAERPWGPARQDAMSMIFNRLAGLDIGPGHPHIIPENIQKADAPARYPFLWNSPRQDFTQWVGFAQNGNEFLALTRNLGQVYGVFGAFYPQPVTGALLNRN